MSVVRYTDNNNNIIIIMIVIMCVLTQSERVRNTITITLLLLLLLLLDGSIIKFVPERTRVDQIARGRRRTGSQRATFRGTSSPYRNNATRPAGL